MVLLEKGKYNNYDSSFKLKVTITPLRLYMDQDTLSFLGDFFTYSSEDITTKPPRSSLHVVQQPSTLFEHFELSPIDTVIDYKPKNSLGQVYSDIRLGTNVWAFKAVELNKAPITLSAITLTKVKDKTVLFEEILSQWIKNFKDTQVYNYLWGTRIAQPVQICVNIGTAVVDFVKTPVEEYHNGGNVLKGIGLGAASLGKKLSVEVLTLGASSAIAVKKGLTKIDRVITGTAHPDEFQHISNYANQPKNISQGTRQAVSSLANGISNSISAIYNYNIPSALIQPAIGSLSALSNLTLGLRNMVDTDEWQTADEKYKKEDV